ncbi:5740_t:CDS:2, partial [Cetraspora pellucida]
YSDWSALEKSNYLCKIFEKSSASHKCTYDKDEGDGDILIKHNSTQQLSESWTDNSENSSSGFMILKEYKETILDILDLSAHCHTSNFLKDKVKE